MAVDILDNYNDYHHATEVHDYKEKQILSDASSSRFHSFSLNDRYDRRFGGDGYRIGLFRRLALVLDGTLLLLDWYLLLIRSAAFIEFTAR